MQLHLMISQFHPRKTAEGPVSGPDQVVDVETALRAMTIEAAYSIRLEREIGSITPGKFANFTVLEESPYAVAPMDLAKIHVWGTVLEGRVQPAPSAPRRRAEVLPSPPSRPRLSPFGALRRSGPFIATDPTLSALARCEHLLCSGADAEATVSCACGGGAYSAILSAMLDKPG